MTLMGLIENRQGLYAARWFLGIAEAGKYACSEIVPLVVLLTTQQYVICPPIESQSSLSSMRSAMLFPEHFSWIYPISLLEGT